MLECKIWKNLHTKIQAGGFQGDKICESNGSSAGGA